MFLDTKFSRKSPVTNDGLAAASSYDWSKDAKATEDSFFGSFDAKPKKTKDTQVKFCFRWLRLIVVEIGTVQRLHCTE